jgi:lipoyl-dependent peroxiredoxin
VPASGSAAKSERCHAARGPLFTSRPEGAPTSRASAIGTYVEAGMKRKASAVWQGGLRDGSGSISTDSGVLRDTQYSFGTRFEQGAGTNPEELIAAAHAGCFSMALSAQLNEAGLTPQRIQTGATVTLEKDAAGFAITAVHLEVRARVPGADRQAFDRAANAAKTGCPVSKVLNASITMDAQLES